MSADLCWALDSGFVGMAAFNAHVDPNGINSIREDEAEAQKSQAARVQSYSQAETGTELQTVFADCVARSKRLSERVSPREKTKGLD